MSSPVDRRVNNSNKYKVIYILVLLLVILGMSSVVQSDDLDNRVNELKSFDYDSKTDFSNIENYVKGEVRGLLMTEMSGQIKQIEQNFAKKWAEENPMPAYFMQDVKKVYGAKYLEDLKGEMKSKLSSLYPSEVGKYLENSLLKDMGKDSESRGQIEQMINQVKQEALQDVGGIVDSAIG